MKTSVAAIKDAINGDTIVRYVERDGHATAIANSTQTGAKIVALRAAFGKHRKPLAIRDYALGKP